MHQNSQMTTNPSVVGIPTSKHLVKAAAMAQLLGLHNMTPDALCDLQEDWLAQRDAAQNCLDALSQHLNDRYQAAVNRAYQASGSPFGQVWADAGGGVILEAQSDRITKWDQEALREALENEPGLLPHVRLEILVSELKTLPDELRKEVEPAKIETSRRPRLRLHPKQP